MKLKSVVSATAAILYGMGTAAAAMNSPVPVAVDLPQELIEKLQHKEPIKGLSNAERFLDEKKTNRQLSGGKPRVKFVPESGLYGQHTYIVRLKDAPVATYDGRLSNYGATNVMSSANKARTTAGQRSKLFGSNNSNLSEVKRYKNYLLQKQQGVLAKAQAMGLNLTMRQQYTNAVNAFSVKMTQGQAEQLAAMPDILQITRSTNKELFTDVGPTHIGADKVWAGDVTSGVEHKGEGMIVGIIDTGVNTDHPSFADVGGDGYDHTNPWGEGVYVGDCLLPGYESMCNDKLIGVRSYDVITDMHDAAEVQDPNKSPWDPNELIAPRIGEDYNGHGSHVAGTAAGNVIYNAPVVTAYPGKPDGQPIGFEFPMVSGVAPHANIVSYSVCYPANFSAPDEYQGCPDEAILAAIDDAIADGVDSINFSIGGSELYPWQDPTELAFLAAREAGINVAVAAGNAGHYYISHTAPWENIVAATHHGRTLDVENKSIDAMTGGDTTPPARIEAQGISEAYTGTVVSAADYGDELCLEPFPEGTFDGEIVVCKRGDIARVQKGENVLAGGAGGFILYNADAYGDAANLVNDAYALPGAHISYWDAQGILTWLASGTGHTATITASEVSTGLNESIVDSVTDFSSRGPSITHRHHFVPTIAAPGEGIFAPYADELPFVGDAGAADWAFLGGTSMASPHVAGALALMAEATDWTPAEIQSAIQMTAGQAYTLPDYMGERAEASHYDAGSGLINVARALSTGFIMDETVEGYQNADPYNGGDPRNMNLPQVLDMNCKGVCTWVRTIKATRDATWTVSADTGEHSVRLRAIPSEFTLKAGEIQTVLIQGEILDSQTAIGNSELEVHGKVTFTPDNEDIPTINWPAAMRFDGGALPEAVNIMAHRNEGKETINNLVTSSIKDFTGRAYMPTMATVETVTIKQDDDRYFSWTDGETEGDGHHLIWVDVPADSKRLMFEVLENVSTTAAEPYDAGGALVLVGYDVNGDGIAQPEDEAICFSNADVFTNWCNINNPDEGNHWILIQNFPGYEAGVEDTFKYAYGVVTGEESMGEVTISGPEMTNGVDPYSIDVSWNLPEMMKGDIYYGAVDLGTDPANAGNIGYIPLRLERGDNEISTMGSQSQAQAGQVVNVAVNLKANRTGSDRSFDIQSALPEHLSLVPDSVYVRASFDTTVTEENNNFVVSGTQPSSADWSREYLVTTNLEDAMCRTPDVGQPNYGDHPNGGYIDLAAYGISPSFGGNFDDNLTLPFDNLWRNPPKFSMYNNFEYNNMEFIKISPMGYVQFDDFPLFWPTHFGFPYNGFPDSLVGVMWKGEFSNATTMATPMGYDMEAQKATGISLATTDTQLFIEWDGARTNHYVGSDPMTWEPIYEALDNDSYDYQLILNMGEARYGAGEYEMVMAYDNINHGTATGAGSIGMQSYYGARGYFYPVNGYLGSSYAWDDLKEKVHDDLVVCYDYRGPESSQFTVLFQVRVSETAAGSDLTIDFNNMVEGMSDTSASYTISVPSSIKVGAIKDYTIVEDTTLEDVMVVYSDSDAGVNNITVTGDNITAVVNGNEAGSTVDITPTENFTGETMVTVTVADNLYPNDAHSTTFKLTVTPVDDAPMAVVANISSMTEGQTVTLDGSGSYDPDGDDITYAWTGPGTIANANTNQAQVSGLAAGNHVFTLTVSDGIHTSSNEVSVNVIAEVTEKDTTKKSSGGAFGQLLLALGALVLATRRRKITK